MDCSKFVLGILTDVSDSACPNTNILPKTRKAHTLLVYAFSVNANIIHPISQSQIFPVNPDSSLSSMSSKTSANPGGSTFRINPAADHSCHLLYISTLVQSILIDL